MSTILCTYRDSIFNWPLRPTGSIAADETFSDEQVDPAWPSEVVADGLRPAEHPPRPGKRIQSRERQKPETRRHGSRAASGHRTAGHGTNLSWSDGRPWSIGSVTKFSSMDHEWRPSYGQPRLCHVQHISLYEPLAKTQLATVTRRINRHRPNFVSRLSRPNSLGQCSCR
jgi:hypothetical protein